MANFFVVYLIFLRKIIFAANPVDEECANELMKTFPLITTKQMTRQDLLNWCATDPVVVNSKRHKRPPKSSSSQKKKDSGVKKNQKSTSKGYKRKNA